MKTPEIGDRVFLNDEGLESIGGLRSARMVEQSKHLAITRVELVPLNDGPVYQIEVDQPSINRFLIMSYMVGYKELNK